MNLIKGHKLSKIFSHLVNKLVLLMRGPFYVGLKNCHIKFFNDVHYENFSVKNRFFGFNII